MDSYFTTRGLAHICKHRFPTCVIIKNREYFLQLFYLISPLRSNPKPHKRSISQVRPSFHEQNSFVALFTHSSLAMFIQMCTLTSYKSSTPKLRMCCGSKASVLEQRHLLWLLFFLQGYSRVTDPSVGRMDPPWSALGQV